jgi:hypothetical protein
VSLAKDLFSIAQRVALLEKADTEDSDHETVYGYYYSKGALDYRDKLLELMGNLPTHHSALVAFQLLLETYPEDYPGPSS